MSLLRFGLVPTRSRILLAVSVLLPVTLTVATNAPDAAPGRKILEGDATHLLLAADRALAPECGQRAILTTEASRPPTLLSPPGEVAPARPWRERWSLDRCGDLIVWDVRFEPFERGGTGTSVGLAGPGEEAPAASPGADRAPLEIGPSSLPQRATFLVTSAIDGGPGSLAQAILDANASANQDGPDLILFRIPGPGPHRISLHSALPAITDPVVIDGYSQPGSGPNSPPDTRRAEVMVEVDGSRLGRPAHGLVILDGSTTVRGLRIQGFEGDGIRLEDGGSNRIEGNIIGADSDESGTASNSGNGIAIVDSPDNTIGGSGPADRNVIEGNGGTGVRIAGNLSIGNTVLGNTIVANAEGGIDLQPERPDAVVGKSAGPNHLQPPPTLTSASFSRGNADRPSEFVVEGMFQGEPASAYRLEVFSTRPALALRRAASTVTPRREGSSSEGERLVGSMQVTTGEDGRVDFRLRLPRGIHSRETLTATVTDQRGNTSEFSPPIAAPVFTSLWNTGSGAWGSPPGAASSNWSPPQVPLASDDVLIAENNGVNTTFSVTIGASAVANSLTLGGGSGTQTLSVGSTLTLSSPSSVGANGVVNHTAGTLTGTGNLTVDGAYNWSGGSMSQTAAGVLTTVNGTLNLSGGVILNGGRGLNITGNGTTHWTATTGMLVQPGCVINNSGVWDSQSNGSMAGNAGSGTFVNSGTFRKSAGTGATSVNIAFTSSGPVEVQSGTLAFGLGGSSANPMSITVPAATLQFGGQTFNINSGSSVTGPGLMRTTGGVVNVNTDLVLAALDLSGGNFNLNNASSVHVTGAMSQSVGIIGGDGSLTIDGAFLWSGGTMSGTAGPGSRTTTLNGPLTVSGSVVVNGGRIVNSKGMATWTAGNVGVGSSGVINNMGTWDIQTPTDAFLGLSGSSPATFNNVGTLKKTGAGMTTVGIGITNSGEVDLHNGTLSLTLNVAAYTQTAGITKLTGGSINSPGRTLNINGGLLAGSGTITGPVRVTGPGALSPGLSAGALNVVGNYTQVAAAPPGQSGVFAVELGGTTAGSGYDQVNISGTGNVATLAGDLSVSLIDSFTPAPGDSFTIMTYPSRTGIFNFSPAALAGCLGWQPTYGPLEMSLTALPVPSEVTGLLFPGGNTGLAWNPSPLRPGTVYDLLRGDLDKLPVGPGADETCLFDNTTGTSATDVAAPAVGHGYWYLVREATPDCGTGTYGSTSGGAPRISAACQ